MYRCGVGPSYWVREQSNATVIQHVWHQSAQGRKENSIKGMKLRSKRGQMCRCRVEAPSVKTLPCLWHSWKKKKKCHDTGKQGEDCKQVWSIHALTQERKGGVKEQQQECWRTEGVKLCSQPAEKKWRKGEVIKSLKWCKEIQAGGRRNGRNRGGRWKQKSAASKRCKESSQCFVAWILLSLWPGWCRFRCLVTWFGLSQGWGLLIEVIGKQVKGWVGQVWQAVGGGMGAAT